MKEPPRPNIATSHRVLTTVDLSRCLPDRLIIVVVGLGLHTFFQHKKYPTSSASYPILSSLFYLVVLALSNFDFMIQHYKHLRVWSVHFIWPGQAHEVQLLDDWLSWSRFGTCKRPQLAWLAGCEQFCLIFFYLLFIVVCQLLKWYISRKKGHLQIFGIIDLVKTKIIDSTVFAATFLPHRIWSRAFGRTRFFFAAFSHRRTAGSWASRLPPFPSTCMWDAAGRHRRLPAIESFVLLPWTAGCHRSPRFVTTHEESLTRGSSAGEALDRRLPSGLWPCIYAKFSLSIAKLPKLQNTNAKLLDTSFR